MLYSTRNASQRSYNAGLPTPESPRNRIRTSGQILQIVLGPQPRVSRAVQQIAHHHHVIFRAGPRHRQILILTVMAVEQHQLLLAMSRVVERVEVQSDLRRRLVERRDELIDEHVPQPKQRLHIDRVLKA